MGTPSERIRAAAIKMARGDLGTPPPPGSCLKLVRLVVEHALFGGRYELYARHLTTGTSRRQGDDVGNFIDDPWAADLEASMKAQELTIPYAERSAGDLVFNHRAAEPLGHAGVLLDRDLVLECVNPAWRPYSIHLENGLVLTPLERWPITLVARLPEPAEAEEGSPQCSSSS